MDGSRYLGVRYRVEMFLWRLLVLMVLTCLIMVGAVVVAYGLVVWSTPILWCAAYPWSRGCA